MKRERVALSPLAHADAIRKVVALGIGKLPRLAPIARERAMMARAALSGTRRRAPANGDRPATGDAPRIDRAAGVATERWSCRSDYGVPGELLDLVERRHGFYAIDRREGDRIVTDIEHTVATLSDATMYTNGVTHRSVFDAEGRLLPRFSSFRGRRRDVARLALSPNRRIPGRTLNAFGTLAMAGGNYSHWLIDGVAMLLLVSKVQGRLDFDRVIVPPMFHDFHLQALELLGVRAENLIELAPLDVLEFEELVCTTPPRGQGSAIQPGWANDGYRALLLDGSPAEPRRKVYVSRRDAPSRNFLNERAVSDHLEGHGFETVELSTLDLAGKARLFAEASCIVSLSGAGLANTMFCSPECTVIEIHPPKLLSYNIGAICDHVGCRYDYLLAEDESVMSRYNPYYGELSLDLTALEKKLEHLGIV